MTAKIYSGGAGLYMTASTYHANNAPFTIGFWLRSDETWSALTLGYVMSFSDSSGSSDGFVCYLTSAKVAFDIYGSATQLAAYNVGYGPSKTFSAGEWVFVLVRYNDPWFHTSVLYTATQEIESIAVHTSGVDINNLSRLYLWYSAIPVGSFQNTGIALAEWWMAPVDIVSDGGGAGGAASSALVRALAYRGVGSIPSVGNKVTTYLDLLGKGSSPGSPEGVAPIYPGAHAMRGRAPYLAEGVSFYETLTTLEATGSIEPSGRPPIYPCFKRPKTLINRQPMIF